MPADTWQSKTRIVGRATDLESLGLEVGGVELGGARRSVRDEAQKAQEFEHGGKVHALLCVKICGGWLDLP